MSSYCMGKDVLDVVLLELVDVVLLELELLDVMLLELDLVDVMLLLELLDVMLLLGVVLADVAVL